jgi:hypothetical protein
LIADEIEESLDWQSAKAYIRSRQSVYADIF